MLHFNLQILFKGSFELLFYLILFLFQLLVHLLLNFLHTLLFSFLSQFFGLLSGKLLVFHELVRNVIEHHLLVRSLDYQVTLFSGALRLKKSAIVLLLNGSFRLDSL